MICSSIVLADFIVWSEGYSWIINEKLVNLIKYELENIENTYWLLVVELIKYCSINSFKFSNVFRKSVLRSPTRQWYII
jgi:hypothetical protein